MLKLRPPCSDYSASYLTKPESFAVGTTGSSVIEVQTANINPYSLYPSVLLNLSASSKLGLGAEGTTVCDPKRLRVHCFDLFVSV